MDRVFQEETHKTWYYIDNKGRKRGWYGNRLAAEIGLEDYLQEEELKNAEATRVPKESGGLLSEEQERVSRYGSRSGKDCSKHDCEEGNKSTCNCSG